MDAKVKLAGWIASKERDYQTGVSIFTELKIDGAKSRFLNTQKPTNIHIGMLEKGLFNFARINKIQPQKLIASAPADQKNKKAVKHVNIQVDTDTDDKSLNKQQTRIKIDLNPIVRLEDLNEEMKARFLENGDISSKMKTLHAELKAAKDDPEKKERRADISHELISIRKKYRENWDLIDAWWKEKQNKSPEQLAAEEALSKQRQIEADLNYVRRNHGTSKPKMAKELELRMNRLDNWGVSYEKLINRVKAVEK
jgi:hypothetical protein